MGTEAAKPSNNKTVRVGMVWRVHCAPANFGRARSMPLFVPPLLRKMRTSFDFDFCELTITLVRSKRGSL